MARKDIKVGTLVTVTMLEDMDPCGSSLLGFKRLWPNGVRIRKKNLLAAAVANLSIAWFAGEIFEGGMYDPSTENWDFWGLYMKTYNDHDGVGNIQLDAARAFWDIIKQRGRAY